MTSTPTQSSPEVADPRAKELPQYSLRQRKELVFRGLLLPRMRFAFLVLGVVLGLA